MTQFSKLNSRERSLFLKYSQLSLPRHTSYPAANFWQNDLSAAEYRNWLDLERRSEPQRAQLGIYVHIPFCASLCTYCGCTREIVPEIERRLKDPAVDYLKGLERERDLYERSGAVDSGFVDKIHLGGGTPTFLTPDQILKLWKALRLPTQGADHPTWTLTEDAELAAEIDPRVTTKEHLEVLWGLGFRRLSLGVQDFQLEVQKKVNRIQPIEIVSRCVEMARSIGFREINFDLIYGLPSQTVDSIHDTLTVALALKPSRVAFYRLAVIPEMFKWQKSFSRLDLPRGEETLDMILEAVHFFQKEKYEFIGFDHFALPEDGLYRDFKEKKLIRNFQGMTTGGSSWTLAFGPSAISAGEGFYAQNSRGVGDWHRALAKDFAVSRGVRLKREEVQRKSLLMDLYCYGEIVFDGGSRITPLERERLERFCEEGLLSKNAGGYQTTFLGQLLTRVLGSALDPYLPQDIWNASETPKGHSVTG